MHIQRKVARRFLKAVVAFGLLACTARMAEAETAYKIGIIGSGNVGAALGTLWAKAGDEIMFSSRHPDELKALAARVGHGAKVGTPAEAAAFGSVVLVAVPYKNFPDVAKANGAALKGKVVLDASNAVENRDGEMTQQVHKDGIGQTAARLLPGTHLVRGFNAIAMEDVLSPPAGKTVGIPLASDDSEAIRVGGDLVKQVGFSPIVVPLARADEFGPGRPLGVGARGAAEWRKMLGLAK